MESIQTAQTTKLNRVIKNKKTAWLLLAISAILMLIDNILKMPMLIGGWHIVLYITLLTPLIYLIWK
ncbi:MAG TPA: hypothetical protein ENK98_04260, partial [Epsilonproteobacteria bacterium]|nr:hypothetical protein [Campylobacterota bacterium]